MGWLFDKKIQEMNKDSTIIPYDDDYLDVAGPASGEMLVYKEGLLGKDKIGGDYVVGKTEMDQQITINPDCLPGQAEIIYLIFLYRLVKWHFWPVKYDEWVEMNPIHAPPFFTMQQTKERLEQLIKQGLNQATQATADYELYKADLRKYDEILEYFYEGKKKGKEHVLRSLFVDRVDAHTGEGYSMISMARRWPTIITDFIRLKDEDDTVEKIQKKFEVSLAEATVLKTKNEIFKHWKDFFFDDVRDRYSRIKGLLKSQEKQMNEYANWLKPYVNKYKRIREKSEIEPGFKVNDAQVFAYTPFSGLRAFMWYYRGFTPEEVGKPFAEIEDPVDDFVLKWARKIEKHYGVSFVRAFLENEKDERDPYLLKKAIQKFYKSLTEVSRTHEMVQYVTFIDKRYRYFALYDVHYEADYMKGSQGPLEMEDIYYNIFPYVISINVLIVLYLELKAKEMRFERYVDTLIGTGNVEEQLRREVDEAFEAPTFYDDDSKLSDEEKEKVKNERKEHRKKRQEEFKKKFIKKYGRLEWYKRKYWLWKLDEGRGYKLIQNLAQYFRKKGPYEVMNRERFSKEYATPLGHQTQYIYNLLKEICYKMSGVKP